MKRLANTFWLAGKELKSVLGDPVMVILILWSFVVAVILEASGAGDTVYNAAIAIVDEDQSSLSRQVTDALGPPWFQSPVTISADQVAAEMDAGRIMFVLSFPPQFEADVIAGLAPAAQLEVDATAVSQAQLGTDYISNILTSESRQSQWKPCLVQGSVFVAQSIVAPHHRIDGRGDAARARAGHH